MQYYICPNDTETTEGQILNSGNVYVDQISCRANIGNAGNWYSWPSSTAGGSKDSGNELNSICPRGWQLTVNAATDPKSYYYLIRTAYNIQESKDERIRLLPMSFVRSGLYDQGSLNNRASHGGYWSSTANYSNRAYRLDFSSGSLNPQNYDGYGNKNRGFSVRCVSR